MAKKFFKKCPIVPGSKRTKTKFTQHGVGAFLLKKFLQKKLNNYYYNLFYCLN